MANDIDFSRYINRYQVKKREEELRQEEIDNYAYDIDGLGDDYDFPDEDYETLVEQDDIIYGVDSSSNKEPVVDSSPVEEPSDDGVLDAEDWDPRMNGFTDSIHEVVDFDGVSGNLQGSVSGSQVIEQIREQKRESGNADLGSEQRVETNRQEKLANQVATLAQMPSSSRRNHVQDAMEESGRNLLERHVIPMVEERDKELKELEERRAKTQKKAEKQNRGHKGKDSKRLTQQIAMASLRDFPKEIYDEVAHEFKAGPRQTDIMIAWILSHADESMYRNVAHVLTPEQKELFKHHKKMIERSPKEKLNQLLDIVEKQSVQIRELRLLLIYLVYGMVGFRQNQTDYQNIGSFDLNEDRMIDFVTMVERQLKILKENVDYSQGRPY